LCCCFGSNPVTSSQITLMPSSVSIMCDTPKPQQDVVWIIVPVAPSSKLQRAVVSIIFEVCNNDNHDHVDSFVEESDAVHDIHANCTTVMH